MILVQNFFKTARKKKMAKICEICGKGRHVGNNVSHANNKTKKVWYPNIQKVRVFMGGEAKRINVCTRCIRSGFITKPPRTKTPLELENQ